MKTILTEKQINLTVQRLAHQVLENIQVFEDTVIIGIQPRGIYLSDKLIEIANDLIAPKKIAYGKLDITFYRDDVRKQIRTASKTDIPFSIENKKVVIVDDVLWTGRTIRASLDALLDFGRPSKVELCVLIDRRFTREYPIQADYIGRAIDTFASQKVMVHWSGNFGKDEVILVG